MESLLENKPIVISLSVATGGVILLALGLFAEPLRLMRLDPQVRFVFPIFYSPCSVLTLFFLRNFSLYAVCSMCIPELCSKLCQVFCHIALCSG